MLVLAAACLAAGVGLRVLRGRARHGGPLLVAVDLAGTVLLVAGGVLLLAAHPPAFAAAAAAAGLRGAWVLWSRSERALARRLRREEASLAAREPGLTPEQRRARLVAARQPRWDPELVARIAREQATPEALARTLRMLSGA